MTSGFTTNELLYPLTKGEGAGHPFHGNQYQKFASKVIEAVKQHGGATISQKGEVPSTGYIVATDKKFGEVVSGKDFYKLENCSKILGDYLVKNQKMLGDGQHYLGLWHNTEGGADEVHLDVVERIADKETAIKAGQDRDQISIWDLANSEEIQTGGKGSGASVEKFAILNHTTDRKPNVQ
jgi:hypothetical protein